MLKDGKPLELFIEKKENPFKSLWLQEKVFDEKRYSNGVLFK